MRSASDGDSGEDEEVCKYMRDKIKDDVCLCKKYGKRINRRACPFCCDSVGQGEPKKKQRKRCRIPTGNYGRTGSLAKPDLLTIPETDMLNHMPKEFLKSVVIKANFRDKSSLIKLSEIRSSAIAHDAVSGTGNKDITTEEPSTNNERMLSKFNTKRLSEQDTVKECNSLKKGMTTCDDLRITSNKVTKPYPGNVRGSQDPAKRIKPANAELIISDQNGISCIRKQRPALIPAQEFIGRYFRPSTILRHPVDNKAQGSVLSSNNIESHVSDKRNFVSNTTDDQKIIDGLSHLSINSHSNLTDNEKRCFQ